MKIASASFLSTTPHSYSYEKKRILEQVQQEGIQVGEMEVKLLQKVEEITLYLIELKRENDELRQEVMRLKRQIQGDRPTSYPRR